MIYILDANAASLDAILPPLQDAGYLVRTFASAIRFAGAYRPGREICIVASASALDMDAIELIERLRATNLRLPPIIVTGEGDRKTIRAVIRAGAAAFIEKPFTAAELAAEVLSRLSRIADRAHEPASLPEPAKIASSRRKTTGKMEKTAPESDEISARPESVASKESVASRESIAARLATLSKREHQVLALVIEGHPSKNIAADLGVSQRTIENHRAAIMRKMGAKSLAQLVRLVLAKK